MPRIDACAKISVPPSDAGCRSLPSIFVGRPRWLSTSNGTGVSAERHRRGVKHGTAGNHFFRLADVRNDRLQRQACTQPVIPASAMDAPITFRKPRRETESTHSEAPLGNSRCSASWKAGLPASSSRLRQYSGPVIFALGHCSISARRESRSSLPFLLGQTSSRFLGRRLRFGRPSSFDSFKKSVILAGTRSGLTYFYPALPCRAILCRPYGTSDLTGDKCCNW